MTHPNRNASLYHLVVMAQRQTPPRTGGVIVAPAGDGASDTAAERTSWELLTQGLSHLYEGGRTQPHGLLTTAISRASLRNAPVASALGVTAPVFELISTVTPCHEAHAQALFLARRMTEAVMHDIDTSMTVINRALAADRMVDRGTRAYVAQLAEMHHRHCEKLLVMIDRLPPPPRTQGPSRGL